MDQKPAGIIDWFARNPRIGLLGTVASVIGLGLGVVFFWVSQKSRDIRYAFSATPTTIVKAGQSSDLRVQFKDKDLTSDVSSIQIAIWNAGKESVRQENILSKTVSLKLDPSVAILETRVKKMTRDLVGFRIDASNSPSGILTFSWNIMEPDDGALLEVIYAGTSEQILLEGAIEGRVPIKRVRRNDEEDPSIEWWFWRVLAVSSLISLFAAVFEYRAQRRSKKAALPATVAALAGFVVQTISLGFALLIGVAIYVYVMTPKIPFAF